MDLSSRLLDSTWVLQSVQRKQNDDDYWDEETRHERDKLPFPYNTAKVDNTNGMYDGIMGEFNLYFS